MAAHSFFLDNKEWLHVDSSYTPQKELLAQIVGRNGGQRFAAASVRNCDGIVSFIVYTGFPNLQLVQLSEAVNTL